MNGWLDQENRVYIIFTIEEIQESLGCSRQKAVNLMAELDDQKGIGLIEKKRQGLGKPNLIFVKNFILEKAESIENTDDFQKSKNHTSGSMKNRIQEVPKLDCNNTNLIHTDFNDIDLNHIQSNHIFETDGKDMIQNRKHYERTIKDNIEYELTYQQKHTSKQDVGNIIDIMVDVCILPDDATIKVNGISMPIGIARERFMEITSMHIDYIIDSLKENPSDVRNIRSYLITTIFNAPTTLSQYYRAKVNHDFSSGAFYKGGDTCKSR
ncbi:replication protein [Fusibacter sp. 3D3]|nr:replication protein [Fusibacter sp. 3D3]